MFAHSNDKQCNGSDDITKLSCDMENLKVIAEVRRRDFFITAKKNDPKKTYYARVRLQNIMQKMISCDPKIKCRDLKHTSTIKLKGGWSETQILEPYNIGSNCVMRGEFSIKNKHVSIRGVIKKAKRRSKQQPLYYQFPKVKCFMGENNIYKDSNGRQIIIAEDMIEVVDKDFSKKVWSARALFFQTKKTPQYEVLKNGTLRFSNGDGAYFVFSKKCIRNRP